jgi:hypothetical protein
MARIFLCHASEDKLQMRKVYQRLKSEGFEPWLDEEEILPGQLWDQEIIKALKSSDFILIFFSHNSVGKRSFVQREFKLAFDVWNEIPEGQIHTIPLRLDDCQVPEQFNRLQWVNLDERGLDRIVRAIRTGLLQQHPPIERLTSSYTITATSETPGLIVYLLDVSASMSQGFGNGKTRIEAVTDALQKVAMMMVQRSIKGRTVAPRYRIAMYAYSSQVVDLLGGVKTIDELANMGVPKLTTLDMTDTAAAFAEAEKLLQSELPNLDNCPAPLVCHLTDGEFNGGDPAPLAQRIMNMRVPDGNVLVENIYIREGMISIPDIANWPGVSTSSELLDSYSQKLLEMSSPVPESYRNLMNEFGYRLQSGARMFFPGEVPDLVELGFVMSSIP